MSGKSAVAFLRLIRPITPEPTFPRSVSVGVKPTELELLRGSIDTDVLATLMDEPVALGSGGTIGVEFRYAGCQTGIENTGAIVISKTEK